MTELNPLSEQTGTPEDVATLYSWANLHGAKYRDFSASRAQTREKARLRVEQALAEEQQRAQQEVAATQAAEEQRRADEAHAADAAHQAELAAEEARRQEEWAAQLVAQRAEQQARDEEAARIAAQQAAQAAAEQAAKMEAERAARLAEQQAAEVAAKHEAELAAKREAELLAQRAQQQAAEVAAKLAAQQAAQRAEQQATEQRAAQLAAEQKAAQLAVERAAQRAAEQAAQQLAQQRAWQQAQAERAPAVPPAPYYPPTQNFDSTGHARPQAYRPAPPQPQYMAQQEPATPRNPWAATDAREAAARPAWLTTENPEAANASAAWPQAPSSLPPAPDDTLQGSRDRLTSRWFALRGVFDGTVPQTEAVPIPTNSRAPAMAVFSLAGGVGKTSLVATLGRALSARGERVLLVDTAAFGLLPFFFGATDQRPGLLRTFNPPGVSSDAPIQMVTLDPEGLSAETAGQEGLSGEIGKFARGASRVIIDLATASGATTRRIMRMSPLVLVPVIPDMNSVVSVSSIDAFFEHNSNNGGAPALPFYVLNQFDASLPLHLDVREVLREQLGERLLPFALRRTPAMSEALAEGMTVMDYAPGSTLAEDFATLAGWVKSLSAPATTSYRGVRWSER